MDNDSPQEEQSEYHKELQEEEKKGEPSEEEGPSNQFDIISLDDDESFNAILVKKLENADLKIKTALDLEEFENIVSENSCRLYLIDLGIGEKADAGLEAIEIIQTKALSPGTIFVVSAQSNSETIVNALEMGADDYLSKPVDFDYLISLAKSNIGMTSQIGKFQKLYDVKSETNCNLKFPMKLLSLTDHGVVLRGPVLVSKGTLLKIQDLNFNTEVCQAVIKLEVSKCEIDEDQFIITADYQNRTEVMAEKIRNLLTNESVAYEELLKIEAKENLMARDDTK